MGEESRVPQWVKVIGLIGGAVGAVAATIASGGTPLIAVLVGVGALTTGVSALYMPPPRRKNRADKGLAVDDNTPQFPSKPSNR